MTTQSLITAAFLLITVSASPAATLKTGKMPEIWLSPLHPNERPDGLGASDYFDLFAQNAKWPTVASRVNVFQVYLDLIRRESNENLIRIFTNLKSRHIALAIEVPILVNTAWCEPGKPRTQWVVPLIEKMKRLGAELSYLTMVGPLVDGHTYTKQYYCHASIREVADDAAITIEKIRESYPNIVIGETEPVGSGGEFPDWTELNLWLNEFARATGRSIKFFHVDVSWGLPWQKDLQTVAATMAEAGISFGVIFNSDGSALSSKSAAQSMLYNASQVEAVLGSVPPTIVFQTWFSYPDHVLPESDPTSMTGSIAEYLKPQSRIRVLRANVAKLLASNELPIRNALLEIRIHRKDSFGTLEKQSISGVSPASAKQAMLALRIHAECTCESKPASIRLAKLQYLETTSGINERAKWDFLGWRNINPPPRDRADAIQSEGIGISCAAERPLLLNGPKFNVDSATNFEAQFLVDADADSEGTGYVALIFFDATGSEIHRVRWPLQETFVLVQELKTDRYGVVNWPKGLNSAGDDIEIRFRGNAQFRSTEVQIKK